MLNDEDCAQCGDSDVAFLCSFPLLFHTRFRYDRDFTCLRVWVWHGCCGVFALLETEALGMLTEQHLSSLRF